jgi:hypothetical protein
VITHLSRAALEREMKRVTDELVANKVVDARVDRLLAWLRRWRADPDRDAFEAVRVGRSITALDSWSYENAHWRRRALVYQRELSAAYERLSPNAKRKEY